MHEVADSDSSDSCRKPTKTILDRNVVNLDDIADVDPVLEEGEESEDDYATSGAMEGSSGRLEPVLERGTSFRQVTMRRLQRRIKAIVRWDKMVSCVAMSGKIRYNAYQYSFYVRSLRKMDPTLQLRTYRAVTGQFWRNVLQHSLPSSDIYHLGEDSRSATADARVVTNNEGHTHPSECVRLVLPSEWVRLDISSDIFFRNVYEHPDANNPETQSIENAPIVQNRRVVCSADLCLWASYDDATCPCERGDKVSFPCSSSPRTLLNKPYDSGWVTTSDADTSRTSVIGYVDLVWCVSMQIGDKGMEACNVNEKIVYKQLKSQVFEAYADISEQLTRKRTMRQTMQDDALHLCLGDVCAFLRPEPTRHTKGVVCLFVASPVMNAYGQPVERLVWVRNERPEGRPPYVRVLAATTVTAIPKWLSGQRTFPHFRKGEARNRGTLPDGTPFYIYRLALYADGFQQFKSLTDVRSVTGVYMLPLGLPLELRRSSAASRVLTIVPHGQDERKVFKIIEEDLIKAGKEGVLAIDPYGNGVRVFIDFVSFFADYPAVSAMCDVRGHTATSFCTFCSMQKRYEACGRNLLYSANMHSRRLGFMRFDERTIAVRSGDPPPDLCQALGFSKQDSAIAADAPLMRYSIRVRELTSNGHATAPHPLVFDSFLNVAAAPDHLFTGIIADVLNVCMMSLSTDDRREQVEQILLTNAYANSLSHNGRFLKWNTRSCTGLRSMTMSTRVGLLLCAVPVFQHEHAVTKKDVFRLPEMLQRLISLVYHLPSEEAEGPGARHYFTDEGILETHGERHRTVRDYIALCRDIYRAGQPPCKVLNKPNVHRALELCVLTIPSFGHARNCSEMVLEGAHRGFKRWLENNSHADSHITAIERTLLKDWLNRTHGLYMQWSKGAGEQRDRAERGLLRLLLGMDGLAMNRERRGAQQLLEDFREAMQDAFAAPVIDEMATTDQWADPGYSAYAWETTGVIDEDTRPSATAEEGMKLLENWYVCCGEEDVDLVRCRKAKYMPSESVSGQRRSQPYNRIQRGCAISVVCRQNNNGGRLIRGARMGEERCTVRFFVVCDLLRASNGDDWCVCRELCPCEGGYSTNGTEVVIVLLGRRVRRVGLLHACDERCTVEVSTGTVQHSATVLRGGVYCAVTRAAGYPPHLG